MRAVITVIGCDKIGIIAGVTAELANDNINILNISQALMDNLFTMIMMVDMSECRQPFAEVSDRLKACGQQMGVEIRIQKEEIFDSMHRI